MSAVLEERRKKKVLVKASQAYINFLFSRPLPLAYPALPDDFLSNLCPAKFCGSLQANLNSIVEAIARAAPTTPGSSTILQNVTRR
ncbi:hypothetical protein E2562_026855 [Oryza meyeriana var. granulata]|uniref:Uncharacterized protein n=1 Tax=Oryza meyeriana var. granulata TaxID=110450 RepID=A0A6G1D8C8_9ORYZ|nr:hypothetical protein E2562_026855 [Oryza meyeriana var. granulata]